MKTKMRAAMCMCVLLVLACVGRAAGNERVVHGAHAQVWSRQMRVDPQTPLRFTAALQSEQSLEALDDLVHAVSNAASPTYGQFLTTAEMRAHWRPSEAARAALEEFLTANRDIASEMHAADDAVSLRMTAATAERVFGTALYTYQHLQHPELRVVRPLRAYSIPDALAAHVLFIDGLESFPSDRQAQFMTGKRLHVGPQQDGDPFAIKSQQMLSESDALATPQVVRAQYGIPEHVANPSHTDTRNTLLIATFLNEYYSENDIQTFLKTFDKPHMSELHRPAHQGDCIAGGSDGIRDSATGEASLDIQVAVSLAQGVSIEMMCYQTLRDPTRPFADDNQEPFLEFMQAVNAMDPAPSVVSISYTDEECAVPHSYMLAVNRELMKAASKGISVLVSSGDAGVQGSHMSAYCGVHSCSRFVPMFPASSPYVTSIGATSLDPTRYDGHKFVERVTSSANGDLVTSGGGFSNVFPQPAYQQAAVEAYLHMEMESHTTPGLFHSDGRGYPDLSALGHAFPVVENGDVLPTDGTSVSAPIVASIVVLLNRLRLAQGQPVLGFLNPLLYQLHATCPQMFQDIVHGDNSCGGAGNSCCPDGFYARPGWDATTGLGTLNFAAIARDLDDCIARIRQEHGPAVLGMDIEEASPIAHEHAAARAVNLHLQASAWSSHRLQGQQMYLAVLLVVVVFAMAIAVVLQWRHRAGDGSGHSRSVWYQRAEPAREYLLGGQQDLA